MSLVAVKDSVAAVHSFSVALSFQSRSDDCYHDHNPYTNNISRASIAQWLTPELSYTHDHPEEPGFESRASRRDGVRSFGRPRSLGSVLVVFYYESILTPVEK